MAQAQVEQAVFASDNNSRMRGYQLVARSQGVDDQIAHELCRWSPTHGGLLDDNPSAMGLSYFHIDDVRVAIGRSCYGTPEYSGRGGLQIVTTYLLTTRDHLAGFQYDPWSMSLMARSEGLLRYNTCQGSELLPLRMAAKWALGAAIQPDDADTEVGREVVSLLREDRKVAIIGLPDPIPTLRWIINELPIEERYLTSFSTELQPSSLRPFRLQFLANADVRLRAELSNHRIAIIKRTPGQVPESCRS